MLRRPHPAGTVVAVEIGPGQFREALPAVDKTSRKGTEGRVVVFDGGRREGSRSLQPSGDKFPAAFIFAPPVVGPTLQEVGVFAEVLTILSNPDLPALRIRGDPP